MKGHQLLQYIIDISEVILAKKQEAAEYLAKLEAAQQRVEQTALWDCPKCGLRLIRPQWHDVCPDCGTHRPPEKP